MDDSSPEPPEDDRSRSRKEPNSAAAATAGGWNHPPAATPVSDWSLIFDDPPAPAGIKKQFCGSGRIRIFMVRSRSGRLGPDPDKNRPDPQH
jgi:hypothetical protein